MHIEGYSTRTFKVDCSRMTDKQLLEHIKAQKETAIYKKDFILACQKELNKRNIDQTKNQPEEMPIPVKKEKKKNQKNNNKRTKNKKIKKNKKPSLIKG